MPEQSDEQRQKAAEEQNKKVQEAARKQVEEDAERQLQAQRDAVGAPVSTAGMTFKEAAAATEALEQPPNPFAEKEKAAEASPRPSRKSDAGSTPPSTT